MGHYTSQRGISLLLLIIMVTVFAGVAIGVVRLLRTRHESYPYQVQSYQAYTLAHAGVEFAIQYTKDNTAANGDFQTFLAANIPLRSDTDPNHGKFNFGNGSFWLRYDPGTGGCNDTLYSRGTVGTATREVRVTNFGRFPSTLASMVADKIAEGSYASWDALPLYVAGGITKTSYTIPAGYSGRVYSGEQITLNGLCDPSAYVRTPNDLSDPPYSTRGLAHSGTIGGGSGSMPIIIGMTQAGANPQVKIMRLGFRRGGSSYWWAWDGACGAFSGGVATGIKSTVPWDGTTPPPQHASAGPQFVQLDLNLGRSPGSAADDKHCRPQRSCDPSNNYGVTCCDADWTFNPATCPTGQCCFWYPNLPACCGPPSPPTPALPNTDIFKTWFAISEGAGCVGNQRTDWICSGSATAWVPMEGTDQNSFVIQADGPIPSGTKVYLSFWSAPHSGSDISHTVQFSSQWQVQTAIIFTVP